MTDKVRFHATVKTVQNEDVVREHILLGQPAVPSLSVQMHRGRIA